MASITQVGYRAYYESDIAPAADADAKALDRMADAAERGAEAGRELAQTMRQTDEQVRRAGPSLDALNRKYDENERLTAQVERANRRYASELTVLRREQEQGLITAERAEELARRAEIARDRQIAQAQRQAEAMRQQYTAQGVAAQQAAAATRSAAEATTALDVANTNARGSMGRFGNVAQQAGFQVQDFFVQVASGQSALVAFAQQAPQFLGIFGTFGALAGAAVAIGAVAFQIMSVGKETETASAKAQSFSDIMGRLDGVLDSQTTSAADLTAQYQKMSKAMQDVLKLDLSRTIADANGKLNSAADEIRNKVRSFYDERQPGMIAGLLTAAGIGDSAFSGQSVISQVDRLFSAGKLPEAIALLGRGDKASQDLAQSLATAAREWDANREKVRAAQAQLDLYNGTASASQVALLDVGKATDAASKAQEDMMSRGRNVTASVRDVWETFSDQQRELNQLLATGAINAETFARAMDKANPINGMLTSVQDMIQANFEAGLAQSVKAFEDAAVSALDEALRRSPNMDVGVRASTAFDGEAQQFSQLVQQALVDGSLDASAILRAGLASAMDKSLKDFYKDFRSEIEGILPGFGEAIGDAVTSFAVAQGIGRMLGLGEDRSRNAGIGSSVGSIAGKFLPGGSKVWSTIGAVVGSAFSGNAKEDAMWQQRTADLDAFATSVSAFVAKSVGLSDLAQRFNSLEQEYSNLRAEAVRLGQPIEALTASYQKQRAVLTQEFADDVQGVIDRLTGNQARADLRALTKAQDQRVQDALIAEYDLARVRRTNALELSDFFGTLTEQQLAMMGGLVTAVDRVKARIRDLTATIGDQLDRQIDLAQQLADSARTQAKALRDLAGGLRDQIKSNLTGDLSPLSPGERYSALSSEFDRLYSAAMGGDQVSAEKIAQAGTNLLEAARSMYATGPAYVSAFDRVQAALAQVATVADIRATALDRVADLAGAQVEILKSIRDVLSTDLGQPSAQAIAAAIADGVLTVDEISAVSATLASLYQQFAALPGVSAQAVKSAIEAIRPQLVAGTLTDAQKEALTTGQSAIATALTNFRQDQLEQYRQALVSAGDAITSVGNFLLDPQGRIPAAVETAFRAVNIDLALTAGIQGLFAQALGGQITFPPLVVQAGQTVSQAVGTWTAEALSSRINAQFGEAIANWTSASDPRTLVQRVDAVFAQAVGSADWNVSLKSLMDQQSPLVTSLTALTAQFPALIAAMTAQAAKDAAGAAYDTGLQAYVSPVMRAASSASTALAGAKSVEAGKSMVNTVIQMQGATGRELLRGGKDSDATSTARAESLVSALTMIAGNIETLTGGTVPTWQVNAANKYGSGYEMAGINKLQSFSINDFTGLARSFINDVLSTTLQGGNSAAIDILRAQDWANLSTSFTSAAQQIYALSNPRPMSAGGIITGGIAGRDSVPILAMPGERMLSVPHSVMLETIYRQAARGSQGRAASDPAQLAELRALREEMAVSRADHAQQARANADLTARLVKSNEEIVRLTKAEKAGSR
ncbi:MAG: hypothetical protein ACOVN0_06155 [Niveispirillum sp.]|uniref:hypothetical protein n=1 Tax=Niveispirillum sp. TaxID=1917217 RepID=UPI003BA592FB